MLRADNRYSVTPTLESGDKGLNGRLRQMHGLHRDGYAPTKYADLERNDAMQCRPSVRLFVLRDEGAVPHVKGAHTHMLTHIYTHAHTHTRVHPRARSYVIRRRARAPAVTTPTYG